MNARLWFRFLCLLLLPVPALSAAAAGLVIHNVNVIPMDRERVLTEQTVVVRDGVIESVAPAGEGPPRVEGLSVIDGSGKYLMPGLAEMHAHLPGGADEVYRRDVLFLYLANGITLIRGMLGAPVHLEIREQLRRGELDGPRLITAGPSFNARSAPDPESGAALARGQKAAGYDFVKVASGSREAFDAMAEAAHEADIPFSGHVPAPVGLPRALEAGYASIDHLDAYLPTLVDPEKTAGVEGGFFGFRLAPFAEPERIREIARRTREAGVWNVPTETLMHAVLLWDLDTLRDERPEFRYMPREVVDRWFSNVRNRRQDRLYDREAAEAFAQVRLDLIMALHEEGAGLLLGSDAPQFFNVPGFSIHPEIALMEKAGLSRFEVLRTATVNPAVFFGEVDDFGQVAAGMRADLVMLNGNPLEDLGNLREPAGVVYGGRWLPRGEIDRRLEEMAERRSGGN